MIKIVKYNKMYIHIPKTSGKNFKKKLKESLNESDYVDYNLNPKYLNYILKKGLSLDFLKENFQKIPSTENLNLEIVNDDGNYMALTLVKHLPLSIWEENGIYQNEKVFTIVRNPYTRLVSFYEDTLYSLSSLIKFKKPTLLEFIKNEKINFILDSVVVNYKKTQSSFVKNLKGDFVCDKFYKMETDQEELFNDFGINLSKEKINTREYNKNYSEIFSDELIEWTQKTFKEDFDIFSYDINPFWKNN